MSDQPPAAGKEPPSPKWIEFRRSAMQAPKTGRWDVVTKEGGAVLGEIAWYGPWRRYCFTPSWRVPTVYEPTCLRDIANFIDAEMAARRKR